MLRQLLVIALLTAPGTSGSAEPPVDPARARQLEHEIARLRGLERRYKQAARGLLEEIDDLSYEILLTESELELARLRLQEGEARARSLEQQASATESKLKELRATLGKLLRTAYTMRGTDPLLVAALDATRPADLGRSIRMVDVLTHRQNEVIESFRQHSRELSVLRLRLEAQNAELRKLNENLEKKRAAARRTRHRREATLQAMEDRKEEAVSAIRRAARELGRLVTDLGQAAPPVSTGFSSLRGSLPWPVNGPVVRGFGVERHPRFHTAIAHNGITVSCPMGTAARAVHAGSVVFADWFKGYGLLVILDHGDSYYTLYGHLEDRAVNVGQKVKTGQVLGRTGSGGLIDQDGLYFEIREGEKPFNPVRWLERRPHAGR